MSEAKRSERSGRTLTDREVSDVRAMCADVRNGYASNRDMLRLAQRIVTAHQEGTRS